MATIAHDIHYQAWMYLYQKRKGNHLSSSLVWIAGTLALGIALTYVIPGKWVAVAYNGVVFWHYFIDGRIWLFHAQPELQIIARKRAL